MAFGPMLEVEGKYFIDRLEMHEFRCEKGSDQYVSTGKVMLFNVFDEMPILETPYYTVGADLAQHLEEKEDTLFLTGTAQFFLSNCGAELDEANDEDFVSAGYVSVKYYSTGVDMEYRAKAKDWRSFLSKHWRTDYN